MIDLGRPRGVPNSTAFRVADNAEAIPVIRCPIVRNLVAASAASIFLSCAASVSARFDDVPTTPTAAAAELRSALPRDPGRRQSS